MGYYRSLISNYEWSSLALEEMTARQGHDGNCIFRICTISSDLKIFHDKIRLFTAKLERHLMRNTSQWLLY